MAKINLKANSKKEVPSGEAKTTTEALGALVTIAFKKAGKSKTKKALAIQNILGEDIFYQDGFKEWRIKTSVVAGYSLTKLNDLIKKIKAL